MLLSSLLIGGCGLLSFVRADCCDTSYDGYCPDGTEATHYCGVGQCNLFGRNCDGGIQSIAFSSPEIDTDRLPIDDSIRMHRLCQYGFRRLHVWQSEQCRRRR